jgi:peptide/nickel transport system permease protein
VTIRHALKNAAIPVITVMGLQFGALVQGAIVVEPILPGRASPAPGGIDCGA